MAEPAGTRVSDADRERAVSEIREHFAAGRLDEGELNERVEAAYGARTQADLVAIRADLPQLPATTSELKAELAQRRAHLQRRVLQESGGTVGVFLVCTVIWVVSGASGQFWPIWVALVGAIALARSMWRLYGPAPELDRVERELDRRAHHGGRHRDRRRRM
jgi:hypothetical protein